MRGGTRPRSTGCSGSRSTASSRAASELGRPVGPYGYPEDKDAPTTCRPREGEVVIDPGPADYATR